MNSDIVSYYRERANEYEKIYAKPERQKDLAEVTCILQDIFRNKNVYEIACGTGYWTERIAKSARSILATDINETVIKVAKTKTYSPAAVAFRTADIFKTTNKFKSESLFGGFIWSHIRLQDLPNFIEIISKMVSRDGTIVFADNNSAKGSNLPIAEWDEQGNSYQLRQLADNSIHKVLKNFPTEGYLKRLFKDKANTIEFINLKYYWILRYQNV